MIAGDMPPADFRRHGREVIDWISEYLDTIRDLPVLPRLEPGQLTERLPAPDLKTASRWSAFLLTRELIVPATTHWNHPRFHAYFSVSASSPGILAEAHRDREHQWNGVEVEPRLDGTGAGRACLGT